MKTYFPLLFILFLFVTCSKDEKIVLHELSTTINPAQSGTINPASGEFETGTKLNLTATPAEGYTFKNWEGDVSGSENPIELTFNSKKNIIAIFEKSDNDGDGIPEENDQCPNTGIGEAVDENGCSDSQKDTDGDGVSDDIDQCPETEEGAEIDATGCKLEDNDAGGSVNEDADGDGISDDVDICPETAEGESVNEQGCSETQVDSDGDTDAGGDADGDGVADEDDECAGSPQGESVNAQGCSESQNDSDNDGVTDNLDECLNSPEGETVNESGCSASQTDTDGDGVNDNLDDCSNTPEGETADENGCSDSQKDSDNDGVNDAIDACDETLAGEDVDATGCPLVLTTFVPDDEFERLLIDANLDDELDNNVLTANIVNEEQLFIDGEQYRITDLTGLEGFESLVELTIISVNDEAFVFNGANFPNLNSITFDRVTINTIEINENSNLELLEGAMSLESLNVQNNNSLTQISLSDSRINSVNCTRNSVLELFSTQDGTFGDITITDNQIFRIFGVVVDEAQSLNLSNNPSLESFYMDVRENVDYPLEFSTAPNLKTILIRSDGRYQSLDVSANPLLETLDIGLSGLTRIDVSNNSSLSAFLAEENPELTCIKVNQDQLENIPVGWVNESPANYTLECSE